VQDLGKETRDGSLPCSRVPKEAVVKRRRVFRTGLGVHLVEHQTGLEEAHRSQLYLAQARQLE